MEGMSTLHVALIKIPDQDTGQSIVPGYTRTVEYVFSLTKVGDGGTQSGDIISIGGTGG